MQRKQGLGNLAAAILLLWLALVATVASVPTSVLAQNSELSSNARNTNRNNNNNGNSVLMTKVKRSSINAKDSSMNGLNAASPAPNAASAGVGPDKKSSPEIVPALYNSPPPSQQARMSNGESAGGGKYLPSNGDIINSAIAAGLTAAAVEAAAAAASNQQRDWELRQQQLYGGGADGQLEGEVEAPTGLLHKRGINAQQYLYGGEPVLGGGAYGNGEYYNGNAGAALVPTGVWADELDPSVVYTDLQDLDDFVPAARVPSYRNKAYDNLQSLLNAEAYLEPMVMPAQYPQATRYYGIGGTDERNKRTALNKFSKYAADMRLKRDTKLTPADMLALVALVEAGERARKDTDDEAGSYGYAPEQTQYGNGAKTYQGNMGTGVYDYPTAVDDVDYPTGLGVGAGTWVDPTVVDYYGMPMNVETMPKYERAREHKYVSGNRYNSKRFMVAKKKHGMGKFLNEPVEKPSFSFSGNAEKYF